MPTHTELLIQTEAAMPPQVIRSTERQGSRSVFGTRRTDKKPPNTSQPEQDLAHLKKMLKVQDGVRQNAQESVVDAQRQVKSFETEANRVRGDLKLAQEQLTLAKEEHSRDVRQAREREASLWNELAQVRAQAAKAHDKASGYRTLIVLSLSLLVPTLSWAVVKSWPTRVGGNKARTETARVDIAALPGGPANTASHDFTLDVQRLDQALGRFGHESAQDVLRKVHDAGAAQGTSVCSFEWNGGQVSLLFGNRPGTGIGTSMIQCADAVEQAAKKTGS